MNEPLRSLEAYSGFSDNGSLELLITRKGECFAKCLQICFIGVRVVNVWHLIGVGQAIAETKSGKGRPPARVAQWKSRFRWTPIPVVWVMEMMMKRMAVTALRVSSTQKSDQFFASNMTFPLLKPRQQFFVALLLTALKTVFRKSFLRFDAILVKSGDGAGSVLEGHPQRHVVLTSCKIT